MRTTGVRDVTATMEEVHREGRGLRGDVGPGGRGSPVGTERRAWWLLTVRHFPATQRPMPARISPNSLRASPLEPPPVASPETRASLSTVSLPSKGPPPVLPRISGGYWGTGTAILSPEIPIGYSWRESWQKTIQSSKSRAARSQPGSAPPALCPRSSGESPPSVHPTVSHGRRFRRCIRTSAQNWTE